VPIYTYVCRDCGEQVEARQDFTDGPLTVCPICGGALRKSFNAVGVVFKGSGFYRNDSREGSREKKPAAATASSETGSSGTSDSSGSSGSEATSSSNSSNGTGSASGSSSNDSSSGSSNRSSTATSAPR
jgi:putative FmdB family regulatory protein